MKKQMKDLTIETTNYNTAAEATLKILNELLNLYQTEEKTPNNSTAILLEIATINLALSKLQNQGQQIIDELLAMKANT